MKKRPNFVHTPKLVSASFADKMSQPAATINGLTSRETQTTPCSLELERLALVKQQQQLGGLSA